MTDSVVESDSFVEYLNAVAVTVSPSLISPPAFSAMGAVAAMLPATLATNTFGFECPLGTPLSQADLSVQATAAHGRDLLAGTDPHNSLMPSVRADPIWLRVHDLARRWADPDSSLHRAMENVWLEFDLDGPVLAVPRPSVFVGLALQGQGGTGRRAQEGGLDELGATVRTVAGSLTGHDLPAGLLAKLRDCLGALGQHEYVFQVGLMLARGAEAVRLCLRLRSTERTLAYLRQVGWAGSDADLRGLLELARAVDFTWLDLDVAETVQPKIGLECYFERHRQPRQEPRWTSFLDTLVQTGSCTAVKRDALLAYPGYTDDSEPAAPWPLALRRAATLLDGRSVSTFVRTLHHVKVVSRPGEPIEAKAYLAATHQWRTSGRGRGEAVAKFVPVRSESSSGLS